MGTNLRDAKIGDDVPGLDADALRRLIVGMREAYARGENAMAYARAMTGSAENMADSVLIAYDLQAGSYVADAHARPEYHEAWHKQLASILDRVMIQRGSIMEVGCGEATTLAGALAHLSLTPERALGFDISWSRIAQGMAWLKEKHLSARLYAADLFDIPLEDGSIDVVYTSHSIEPNGGREEVAIRELLRVARRAVVLIEPIYELAGEAAKARMVQHGFVRGLKDAALRTGATIADYRLLEVTENPLNPSGLMILEKSPEESPHPIGTDRESGIPWRCPLTHTPLVEGGDVFLSVQAGLVYPVLRGVPMLRKQHVIVASGITG